MNPDLEKDPNPTTTRYHHTTTRPSFLLYWNPQNLKTIHKDENKYFREKNHLFILFI